MSEKLELRNFVGGEHVDVTDGRRMDLVDPSTGEVFASAPVSGAEDVDRAYRAAAEAFETWRTTPRRSGHGPCCGLPTPLKGQGAGWWRSKAAKPASPSG